jgi:dynein heavy chain
MPSPRFPVPILQNSIKQTQEPPRGLKANLKRTFMDVTDEQYEGCSKPHAFKKLLFGLAFYHALILERRKFGAIGWNIPYEWMNSDLKTGMMQLRMYLEEQPEVPYETLNAVVGDVTYGGRVTDSWDKRTNLSLLLRYFCPEVLEDRYRFSESGAYHAPAEGELAAVRAYVDSLPLDDSPEVFGLHENASITLQQKETNELMETLISVQPRTSSSSSGGGGGSGSGGAGGGGGAPGGDPIAALATDIAARLPAELSKASAHASTFAVIADGSVNSLGVFVEQEMSRFNRLLRVMRRSLTDLGRAVKGLVVMSSELEAMYAAMTLQRVPPAWEAAAYPSLKPLGPWVADLCARIEALAQWVAHGPPASFWISGFFFPQGFMTGALQSHARKTRIAIDTLAFRTVVTAFDSAAAAHDAPANGVYIHGLFLEGARWAGADGGDKDKKGADKDKKGGDKAAGARLAETRPGVLFARMPVVWLDPAPAREVDAAAEGAGAYACPLYKTSRRAGTLSTTGHSTNFVTVLHLPSDKPQDHWVRRGVALLTQLDE